MAWTEKEKRIAFELADKALLYREISEQLKELGYNKSPETIRGFLANNKPDFNINNRRYKVDNHVTTTTTSKKTTETVIKDVSETTIKVHRLQKPKTENRDELSDTIHLVIPDPHAKPGVSNERFEWLAGFIADIKPDVVICLGDFADMESLSSYDKKKGTAESRRIKKDIDAVIDAQEKLFNDEVCKLRDLGSTRFVMTLGNHEDRIRRAVNDSPEFEGFLSIDNLKYKDYGWEIYPYLDRVVIDEIAYAHYFPSGPMNKAIGGEYPASSVIKKQFMSCTMGHSHIRDFAERTRGDGNKIHGLVAGCFFDHEEDYALVSNSLWWRGIVVKRHVRNGMYEPEFVPITRLKQLYN